MKNALIVALCCLTCWLAGGADRMEDVDYAIPQSYVPGTDLVPDPLRIETWIWR